MSADHLADAREAREALDHLLALEAPALRASLPTTFADAVERYAALLLDANDRLNLTRVVEPEAVARLHLLDALSALPLVDDAAPERAVDLGSGGGVPGIVLGLARPGISWILVDSVRKKADALARFVNELGLRSVAVEATRAEEIGQAPDHREAYDLVTARAVAPLAVLAEYALPLLRLGGTFVAWKALMDAGELAGGRAALERLGGDEPEVRGTGIASLGGHRLVVVRKSTPTPAEYPRRPGTPSRRPLG